jgi:beta-lactamase regulating signal transducer with metallopeptidase domain
MSDATIPAQAAAWLLTYALHSTLFLGLAWLAARRLRRMPAVEEAVWRFALVAGLVTASLQLASGREPLAGRWNLASQEAPAVSAAVATPALPRAEAAPRELPRTTQRSAALVTGTEGTEPFRLSIPASLPLWVAGLWAAGALLFSGRWLAARVQLHRRLRARPVVVEATMVDLLDGLQERAGLVERVRLTCSSRLPVPVALGVNRPEICVPPRALASLTPEQQEGMLAHELAHLVRRDPFWLGFGQLMTSLFFFQPLGWIAARRLREISEMRCDEWAVGRTGRPLSLARCLAEVAGWSFQPLGSFPAPSMADRPSHLAQRIRRLLDDARSPERRVHPVWLAAGMAALLIVGVAAAPGVAAAVAGEKAPAAESAPVPAQASRPAPAPAPTPVSEPMEVAEDDDLDDLDDLEGLEEDLESVHDLKDLEDLGDGLDLDLDEELDIHLDELIEGATQLAANLAGDLSGEMDAPMTEEEAEAFAERMEEMGERIGRQVDDALKPRMKQMEKQLEMSLSRFAESDEMRQLEREAEKIAERARPSEEEMARLHADIEKLRAEGGLSAEEKQKIREEARRIAEKHRLTDQDRAEIDRIQRQAREMAERSIRENQAEIDQIRQQMQQESEAIREQVRRQLENDPELRRLREKAREDRRKERNERREERREEKERAPRPPGEERQVRSHRAPVVAPAVAVHVVPVIAPTPSPLPAPAPPPVR